MSLGNRTRKPVLHLLQTNVTTSNRFPALSPYFTDVLPVMLALWATQGVGSDLSSASHDFCLLLECAPWARSVDPFAQFLSLHALPLSELNSFFPTALIFLEEKAHELWDIITGLFAFQMCSDSQLVFWLI